MWASVCQADVDWDRNGEADSWEEFDALWSEGMITFFERLKSHDSDMIIVANDAYKNLDEYQSLLNGSFFENQLTYWLDREDVHDWMDVEEEILNLGVDWSQNARSPKGSFMALGAPEDSLHSDSFDDWAQPWNENELDVFVPLLDEVQADQKRMRFGLAIATISGVGYLYDWGPTSYGGTYWFYPEYDANGRGRHYLGKPLSPYETLSFDPDTQEGLFQRRFERGLVIANAYDSEESVDIGDGYYDISGNPAASPILTTGKDAVFLITDPNWSEDPASAKSRDALPIPLGMAQQSLWLSSPSLQLRVSTLFEGKRPIFGQIN